jgi:hypothetical protein
MARALIVTAAGLYPAVVAVGLFLALRYIDGGF